MGNSDSQTNLGNRVKGHIRKLSTSELRNGMGAVVVLGAGALAWQLFGPNTSFDLYMAKNVWCEPQTEIQSQPQKKTDITSYSGDGTTVYPDDIVRHSNVSRLYRFPPSKLDHLFVGMANGDSLKLGGLEIKAIDSRPQTTYLMGNRNDDLTLIGLNCPGYIKVDVTHNGQPVPGGSGIEIVYAAKFFGAGGLLDGWPDFTLKDVLSKTSLSSNEISQLIINAKAEKREADYQAKLQEEDDMRMGVVRKYQAKAENDPAYQRTVEQCNAEFKIHQEADGGIISMKYVAKKGDNPIKIAGKFQECDDDGAFFPKFYFMDVSNGDICTSPQDIKKVNQIIDRYGNIHFQMMDNCNDKSEMKWHKGKLQEIRKIGVGQPVYFPASVLDYSPKIK